MSAPRPPVKTKLGIDELRQRTHGLSQRHRTTLFFIDGQRSLSEVLTLTQRAGGRTTHLADLVHWGMVDVGTDTITTAAELNDSADTQRPVAPVVTRDVPAPAFTSAVEDSASALSPQQVHVDIDPAPGVSAVTELEELHQEVRSLLIDTLRMDAPLFAAITLVRVRRAQKTRELINLVWEIERYLVTSKKSPNQLATLHRARELLGMGNTHVSTDAPIGLEDSG